MTQWRQALVTVLASGLIAQSLQAEPGDPQVQPTYKVIGYIMGPADIARIPVDKVNELNFAFATLDRTGAVVLSFPGSDAYLRQLVTLKATHPALKIVLSIGGWGADHFSEAALDESSRARFVATAMALLTEYRLDGLDIDWEYPGQPGPGISYRPADRENFTALLHALRVALEAASDASNRPDDDRYVLTAAVAGGNEYFKHTDVAALGRLVDWFNVMTYDFRGEDSAVTGHHAELFASESEAAGLPSGDAYIQQYRAAGIPSGKLVLGAAFYGKIWEGVVPVNEGLGQTFTHFAGDISYADIVRRFPKGSGFVRRWDPVAKAAFLWNASTHVFISYEDAASLREKARYAQSHGLLGVMYWEQGLDPDAVLTGVLYDHLQ